ncbi:MAG: histidine phosphatase family protein [Raineya sp.]|nr:histidine phosphatase family protein [Raineya sp.]MDW8295537.1 histidine phosphatase family protein [Raineya sp.]
MLKNIYLIRHGETDYNRKGMVQGRGVDADLNETGKKQAQAFFQAYQHLPIEKIYYSTLKRTYQTVLPFVEKGIAHLAHEGLDEISWGIHEGKPFSQDAHEEYLYYLRQWRAGNTHVAIAQAETPEEVKARQEKFTQTLLQSPEKNVLICSHGRAMRILLTWWLGYPLSQMDMFQHFNLSLYHLQYTGSMFRIVKYNCLEHLKN